MTTHQQWDIVTSVGITALGVAAARAIETHRDEPMIDDPFAAAFVRAAEPPTPMPTTPHEADQLDEADQEWTRHTAYMGIRTRFFDDFFERAWDAGVRQSVILASGLDARPVRLAWPSGSVVYEIDQPKVLEFKEEVLAAHGASSRCEHRMIPIDLRGNWASALSEAGFDHSAPTAWLAEGLLPYLPPEAEQQLLDTIDRFSAPGSRLAIEHAKRISRIFQDEEFERMAHEWGVDIRSLVHDDDRPDAAETLRAAGWVVTAEPVGPVADRYRRPLDPSLDRMSEVSQFITAQRQT